MSDRGKYGEPGRGDPRASKKKRGWGWKTVAVVAGVGAGAYFIWPMIRKKPELPPPEPPPPPQPIHLPVMLVAQSLPPGVMHAPVAPIHAPVHAPTHAHEPHDPHAPHHLAHAAPMLGPEGSTSGSAPYTWHPLDEHARRNGFSSVTDYENSVVLNARQARSAGANVTLPHHLSHLADRIGR